MITLKEYKQGKIAINTRTQEEYDNLMRFFDSKKMKWFDNSTAIEKKAFHKELKNYITFSPEDSLELYWKNMYDYKIITPNQLKEYNEFMGKETIEEDKIFKCGFKAIAWLKENPDREILYTEQGYSKNRLKYDLEYKNFKKRSVNIMTEEPFGDWYCVDTLWIKMFDILNWREIKVISVNKPKEKIWSELVDLDKRFFGSGYQCGRKSVNEIMKDYLKSMKQPETQYLSIGQAIDYMLESEDNVIECLENDNIHRISLKMQKDGFIKCKDKYSDIIVTSEELILDRIARWKKIKKHIEPKQKTLKELIQEKEPFQYKNNWYRFNKDGAVIDKKGSAVGLDKIKELLTKKECEDE